MFNLDREEKDNDEDSAPRSILGLGQAEASRERGKDVANTDPPAPTRSPDGPSDSAPATQGDPDATGPLTRSFLGLENLEQSPQWRAAVAASPARDLFGTPKAQRPEPKSASRQERDEDSRHQLQFGLERSEFAYQRKPSASAASAPEPLPPPPKAGARARDPLLSRDLLSLREHLDPAQIDPPQFEHDLRPPSVTPIPVERAIFLSLIAHLLVLLLLLWAPAVSISDARRGLLGAFIPEPKPVDKIPIVFRSAPGPERENPKRSEPSDKNRRAGGGDRSRPKSDTPFVPQRPGIEGLAPGQGRTARAAPPAAPAPAPSAEKAPPGAAGEQAKAAEDGFRVPPPGAAAGTQAPNVASFQQAIRDAARQVGSQGQGGAGFPNPDGGFVDTGGLSFESTWFQWGDYWDIFVRRVKLHWKVPLDLMMLGAKGKVTITMAIMADGRLADMKVVRPSPTIPFNFSAEQALETSSPFRPLPKELLSQVPGKDRERVTVTFFYNVRPGHENDPDEPPKPSPR